jgi:hypothetical protein
VTPPRVRCVGAGCVGDVACDEVAGVGVDGLPAPVPAHYHVPAAGVRRDAFDRLRVVVHGGLVGDDDVTVEGEPGQGLVDAPVQVSVGHAGVVEPVAVRGALPLLVGDNWCSVRNPNWSYSPPPRVRR